MKLRLLFGRNEVERAHHTLGMGISGFFYERHWPAVHVALANAPFAVRH
jgi:hypothetical protein